MTRKKILLMLLLLPFLVFMASGEGEHSSGLVDFLGKTVNFILLFGGLTYLLYKPIRSFLEKRGQDIQSSLKKAEDSRAEAERRLKEIEARLAGLQEEIERIKEEGRAEGRRAKERTLQLAQQEAERIKHFASQEIDSIIRSGIRELKEYTAELATALAEEQIKRKMSPEVQAALINKSIERLDKIYEKSDSGQEIHPGAG
ncbi:MAG: ATP synthase F0 subunit B [Candidatus Aminicenantes bacterium]|nr:ATP synthase F0 subunit B [Candidatus Aminicenantes bacterium]